MIADRWEWMSKNQMSCAFPLRILPLMESMGLVKNADDGKYWIGIEFNELNEQTGVIRTLKYNTQYAYYLHNQLRIDGYYK